MARTILIRSNADGCKNRGKPDWLPPLSFEARADAVDHFMQPLRGGRIFCHPPSQGECRRIEQSPRGLVAPIMRRLLIGPQHIGDSRDVDHAFAVERHDCLISYRVREFQRLVPAKRFGLCTQRLTKWFNHPCDQTGKIAFGVGCMLSADKMIRIESKVVANEDAGADGDADRELLLVAVPQADHVRVVPVGRPQGQDPEVVKAVQRDGMMLFEQFMAIEAKGVADHFHHRVMGDGHMAFGWFRGWQVTEIALGDVSADRVQHEGHFGFSIDDADAKVAGKMPRTRCAKERPLSGYARGRSPLGAENSQFWAFWSHAVA